MPIYMDRHYVEGLTWTGAVNAHQQDLDAQAKYGVSFMTFWVDDARSTVFCLAIAPDKESLQRLHRDTHGLIPNEVIEVDPTLVQAFLGRVKDPTPVDISPGQAGKNPIDAAFRAIMFTDLKDSTLMTSTLGDTKALHLLHIHNALTRNALQEHHGNEVKHTGDGIMASFAPVINAVECAVAIQKAFSTHNKENPGAAMHLRIGLSAGEPVEEHGDLFGHAVQLAARICAHAEPGQILVAQVVRDLCQGKKLPFSDLGEITPKGIDRPIRVYQVMWPEL